MDDAAGAPHGGRGTRDDLASIDVVGRRILIVEDDDGIAVPLERTLAREGYEVERVAEGARALERSGDGFDLVVLDLGLPDMDGLDVCRRLREDGFVGGIIILTARDGELDRVVGLDVGADDYIAKPFALAELLARLRALLRRSPAVSAAASSEPSSADRSLSVDIDARRAFASGREIALSTKEFDLLAQLDKRRGTVVTREQLMDEVWDENWFGSTKTLDVTVARLRQKLDDAGAGVRITTLRGVGFRLDEGNGDA
ncbi:response regulator transcription factor [Microbacterium sp. ARD31]|uniref:response regulator transcription factor n=1 Tax=Microbacterium sp. ARD31 TaxID=2962576 RepID=UPI002881ACE0|nr:response regulator transcription factor [Microbacterium sp. ARD31]MDT0184857.1 response regulator transcription factor [Microbacterium sp. ARD31]